MRKCLTKLSRKEFLNADRCCIGFQRCCIAAVLWFLLRGRVHRPADACQKRFSFFQSDSEGAKVCKTCRSRQELSIVPFFSIFFSNGSFIQYSSILFIRVLSGAGAAAAGASSPPCPGSGTEKLLRRSVMRGDLRGGAAVRGDRL